MDKTVLVAKSEALPHREESMSITNRHTVLDNPLQGPWPTHAQKAYFAMGCFWGVEKLFWQLPGVYSTAVGYMGGFTKNASYEDVCSGQSGHTETVMVVYNQELTDFWTLLEAFWKGHNPTQGMKQGNDVGTQYRSAIFWMDDMQKMFCEKSRGIYQENLTKAGFGNITTEIKKSKEFYFAENEHQQYLDKHPAGYCGLAGTGVEF
jgi:peptide-methionine (S)-S-oxide reductase